MKRSNHALGMFKHVKWQHTFDECDARALELYVGKHRRATLPRVTENVSEGSALLTIIQRGYDIIVCLQFLITKLNTHSRVEQCKNPDCGTKWSHESSFTSG